MYQAIVLLPLLGAILAGLISLAGARARHPGGSAAPGAEDHAAGHVPEHHPRGAPSPHGDVAVIHPSHHEPEQHVPPAAGSRAAEVITTSLLFFSMLLSWIAFWQVGFGHHDERITLFTWIASGDLKGDWALRIDTRTAVMLVVVTTISSLVHLYSIAYMEEDPHRPRFFCYLSLFTFAMLALVTSDNLAQLFFGWEGVGLASYLLIGFWYHKPEANAAAIKAFIVNRVGDFGFALGIFAVFMMTGSIDFDTVFAQAPALTGKTINFFGWHADALTLICLLLFLGAMGKSAQFLLHTWLPDAMEGPTPVSALIFAATVGLVQNDIKRIVAYSTCSQLGYMFVAMGVGAYSVGMFHLFTHAFFKALLFLKTFHGRPHDQHHYEHAHERRPLILITLLALAAGSILAGYPFKELFAGHAVEEFFRESIKQTPDIIDAIHHVPVWVRWIATVMMVLGFAVAYMFYIRKPQIPVELARQHDVLYRFLLNKWYFDEIYDFLLVRPAIRVGRLFWKGGDGWLIDGFGPDGVSARVIDVTRNVVRLQTGYLYHYAFVMLIGAAAMITWFMFAGPR